MKGLIIVELILLELNANFKKKTKIERANTSKEEYKWDKTEWRTY